MLTSATFNRSASYVWCSGGYEKRNLNYGQLRFCSPERIRFETDNSLNPYSFTKIG